MATMHIPSEPPLPTLTLPSELRDAFAVVLGISPQQIVALGQNALADIIIELDAQVDFSASAMTIDPVKLLTASPLGTRSQVITSAACVDGGDFVKRVFAYGGEGA